MKVKVIFIVFKLLYLPVRVCQNCKDVFFVKNILLQPTVISVGKKPSPDIWYPATPEIRLLDYPHIRPTGYMLGASLRPTTLIVISGWRLAGLVPAVDVRSLAARLHGRHRGAGQNRPGSYEQVPVP